MRIPLGLVSLALLGAVISASASVQITKFDPPVLVNRFPEPGTNLTIIPAGAFQVLAMDFNLDGQPDFSLGTVDDTYGFPSIVFFFNSPAQVLIRRSTATAAGLPFWSVVGPSLGSNRNYQWSMGTANPFAADEFYGDRKLEVAYVPNVMPFGTAAGGLNGLPLPAPPATIGQLPNFPVIIGPGLPPSYPFWEGDVVGKKSVIAVQFIYFGEIHYGYIEVDFHPDPRFPGNLTGFIYGWAFETDPNTPIIAAPLDNNDGRFHGPIPYR